MGQPRVNTKNPDALTIRKYAGAHKSSDDVLQQGINKLPEHVDDAGINKATVIDSEDIYRQGIRPGKGHHDHVNYIGVGLDHLFHLPNDLVVFTAKSLVRLFLNGEDPIKIAAGEDMIKQLLYLILKYNIYIYSMFLGGLLIFLLAIIVPLVWRLAKQRVVTAFISFSHSMEEIAEYLERELKAKGIRVGRIPYKKHAEHQEIVVPVQDCIIKCDALFCIPGPTASFVESEVMAASTTKKIIFFLTGEYQGTLPNTADKRYPVFKLERVIHDKFASCIGFLRYSACDFRSTLDVLGKSISKTVRVICSKTTMITYLLVLSFLYALWSSIIVTNARFLESLNPVFNEVTFVVMLACFITMGMFIPVASSILFCSLSFLYAVGNMINIQRRIRFRVGLGKFQRKEWIGRAPGLVPGEVLYESLFEISPVAHHEKDD
jgi:hypothetical protein